MMATNLDEKHAFPVPEKWNDSGMSARAYFAAHAPFTIQDTIQYLKLSDRPADSWDDIMDALAAMTWAYADKMMERLGERDDD